ncbi:MAG TPA: diguanylate cyclase, partial [Synergistales bacterium]|nr:diguanylate cyclase [Synergistales bacterium]
NDGLWDWNLLTGKVYFDPRYYTMAGYEPNEFPSSFDEWAKRLHPDDHPLCNRALQSYFSGKTPVFDMEFRFRRKDGSWMWIRGRGRRVESDANGNAVRMVGTHIDITELKQQQQEIQYLSFHDHLTGLYNRRFFDEELARLDTPRNMPLTLFLMDVNGLKLTNDAFGHQAGDRLLRTVADVLRRTCREDEIIARIGGDEFILLLPQTGEEDAASLGIRLREAFENVRMETGTLSVAFGWATKNDMSQPAGNVFITAENRMYQQKIYEMNSVRSKAISFILETLYENIPRERRHSENVGVLSGRIGVAMDLDAEAVKELVLAGKLHDIGKIAIGAEILDKNGSLNESEWLTVKRHPEIGYFILNSVSDYASLAIIALAHQERFDGRGYPKGLSGGNIPLHARIIAVADAYDAMTSGRPYRPPLSSAEALREIRAASGTQFDPSVVEVFLELFKKSPESIC